MPVPTMIAPRNAVCALRWPIESSREAERDRGADDERRAEHERARATPRKYSDDDAADAEDHEDRRARRCRAGSRRPRRARSGSSRCSRRSARRPPRGRVRDDRWIRASTPPDAAEVEASAAGRTNTTASPPCSVISSPASDRRRCVGSSLSRVARTSAASVGELVAVVELDVQRILLARSRDRRAAAQLARSSSGT